MKRLGRLWNDILDINNGFIAVVEGTKNKRNQWKTKQFFFSDEEIKENPSYYHQINPTKAKAYVSEKLIPQLKAQTWKPKSPKYTLRWCPNKTHKGGKWRNLYIPDFDDHIIAHMVMKVAMPAFTKGMHPNCCGSVPGRGIKHIVKKTTHWLQDDKKCRYFVKLDIHHFFDNIQADKLISILEKKIKDKYVLWVFKEIIESAPVACPVGYYTSPFFANLYLQDFDWYVEQQLYKVKNGKRIKYVHHYLRYMDDMLLIGTSKKDLTKAIKLIQIYLKDNYNLEIKSNWEIKKIGKHEKINEKWKLKSDTYWCDIGGYKFCKDATIMRDGIFLASQRLANKMSQKDYYTMHQCQSLISRIGWATHCNSNHFTQGISEKVDLKNVKRIISNGNMEKSRKR